MYSPSTIVGSIELCWTSNGCATKLWMTQVDEQGQDERLDDLEGASQGTARTGALAGGGRAGRIGLVGEVGHRPWAAGWAAATE